MISLSNADDCALQFGWLWLNHQFSDFILELHVHPPLQQEEGDEDENISSSGPGARSPIKRACTPAVSPPSATAAMAAAIGPPHPPDPDAGGRMAAAREADRPNMEGENANADADTAVVAVSGVGGPGTGESRNVRFTNLQSREVEAAAAAAAAIAVACGSDSSGRGGRQGVKATSFLTWPRLSAGKGGQRGAQIPAHGPGMSLYIERRNPSGSAPSTEARGSAAAAAAYSTAAPLPSSAQSSAERFKGSAVRQPSPNSSGGGGGGGCANVARGSAAAAAVVASVPTAGLHGLQPARPGTATSFGHGGSAAILVTSPTVSGSSSASAVTTGAGRAPQLDAAEPTALFSQGRRLAAPSHSLSAGPGDSRNGGADSEEGDMAAAGRPADALPDQQSEQPTVTWEPQATGECTNGVQGLQVGAAAADPRVGRIDEALDRGLCPAGAEDVDLIGRNNTAGGGEVNKAAVAADEPLMMTTIVAPSTTGAVATEAAAALATSPDMAADEAAADRSYPSPVGFTTVRWPASMRGEVAPTAFQGKLEGTSAVASLTTVTLSLACSAPSWQQGPPLYDAMSELGFGGSVDSGGATVSGGMEAGGRDDELEPSGSWAGEDQGTYLLQTGGIPAAAAAATCPLCRTETWASGAAGGAGGGSGGGASSFCGDDAAAATASDAVRTSSASTSCSLDRSVAATCTSSPPRPRPVRVYPVHAAVLAATSDYFRTLLQNWTGGHGVVGGGGGGGRGVLTMFVDADQVEAAEMMLHFMYTGRLPSGLSPAQLLALLMLADQYAVGRLLAAVDTAFAGLPLPGLSLEQLLRLYELPEVLLAGGALNSALSKLVDKLISELGDLEMVMDCPARKAQLLGLPYEAVRLLLQSPETRVWNENSAVAALVEWMAGPEGQMATQDQRRQLVALLRLQHCTHSYISYILPQIPWLLYSLDPTRLLLALSWSRADASTRDVYTAERYFEQATSQAAHQLHQLHQPQQNQEQQQQQRLQLEQEQPNHLPQQQQQQHEREERRSRSGAGAASAAPVAAPGMALPGFVPRPRPVSQRVTFDWSIDFATLQQLYSDSRATRSLQVVTSEPAFFGGFFWWLRYDLDASQPLEYREHMGLACNVKLAGRKHSLPCVKVKATVCARQDAGVLGEGSYSLRKSFSYHVMNACPVGLWGFFGLTPDRDEASWRRFLFEGRVWLRCSIEDCQ
ncbi:hypothetical protein VaNZ11_016690 [Volvox africanus]|uniref:BTB domain-containing protein n=1 Tax=Volvox africanus TaxID=51714 RepID=A0ABQ5SQ08_9CHLO|nr:hypothetical protein VaNZ11_016690 [Volvox africanus]